MSAFDLYWSQLMSSTKFVELERTMQWGVHLNKSHARCTIIKNGGAIAIDFYCDREKVWPLSNNIMCCSNQSACRLLWLLGLEWNKYKKDLSQPHQAFNCQACPVSIHFLCVWSWFTSCVQLSCRRRFTFVNRARSIWKEHHPFPHQRSITPSLIR
jgi:hypothetical protein